MQRHWTPEDDALAEIASLPTDTVEQRRAAMANPAWRMWASANGDVHRAQIAARAAMAEVERLRQKLLAAGIDPDKE